MCPIKTMNNNVYVFRLTNHYNNKEHCVLADLNKTEDKKFLVQEEESEIEESTEVDSSQLSRIRKNLKKICI